MTQNQLDHEVAHVLGEDVREIQRHGFTLADPDIVNFDPEPYLTPQIIDWDEVDLGPGLPR